MSYWDEINWSKDQHISREQHKAAGIRSILSYWADIIAILLLKTKQIKHAYKDAEYQTLSWWVYDMIDIDIKLQTPSMLLSFNQ